MKMNVNRFPAEPYAYIDHKLVDHLCGARRYAEKFIDKNNWDRVLFIRLLRCRPGYSKYISEGLVRDILLEIAYMHDIGKAAVEYQAQHQKRYNESDWRPSFRYHEYPSAYIFCKFIKDKYRDIIGDLGVLSDLSVLSSLAVLKHIVRSRDAFYPLRVYKWDGPIKWTFKPYVEYLSSRLGIDVYRYVGDDGVLSWPDVYEWLQSIHYKITEKKYFTIFKLYILFLAPTYVGDNIDSFNSRGDRDLPSNARKLLMEDLRYLVGGGVDD